MFCSVIPDDLGIAFLRFARLTGFEDCWIARRTKSRASEEMGFVISNFRRLQWNTRKLCQFRARDSLKIVAECRGKGQRKRINPQNRRECRSARFLSQSFSHGR